MPLCSPLTSLLRPRRTSAPPPLADATPTLASTEQQQESEVRRRDSRDTLNVDCTPNDAPSTMLQLDLGLDTTWERIAPGEAAAVVVSTPEGLSGPRNAPQSVAPPAESLTLPSDQLVASSPISDSSYLQATTPLTPLPPPAAPSRPRRFSVSSAGSLTSYSFISSPPSSPRSANSILSPPSPLTRRISTRLDQEGRRVLARRSSTRSPKESSDSSSGPTQKTRRVKTVFGVGSGESSEEEDWEGRSPGRLGGKPRSSSSPALHLGEHLEEELELLPRLSHSEPSPMRHPATMRRNSAPDGRAFLLRQPQPIQPFFQPLPSPPPSARTFSFTMTPIRWTSGTPATSPASSTVDLRDPESLSTTRPRKRVLSCSSLSIGFISSPSSSCSSGDNPTFVIERRADLTRRRTDRRPPRVDVVSMTTVVVGDEEVQERRVQRTLTITNPDSDHPSIGTPTRAEH